MTHSRAVGGCLRQVPLKFCASILLAVLCRVEMLQDARALVSRFEGAYLSIIHSFQLFFFDIYHSIDLSFSNLFLSLNPFMFLVSSLCCPRLSLFSFNFYILLLVFFYSLCNKLKNLI